MELKNAFKLFREQCGGYGLKYCNSCKYNGTAECKDIPCACINVDYEPCPYYDKDNCHKKMEDSCLIKFLEENFDIKSKEGE